MPGLTALCAFGRPAGEVIAEEAQLASAFRVPTALNWRQPLQYAAAYVSRSQPELVASLRTLTKGFVPGGLPVLHKAAFAFRRARLRAVQTNIHHAPVAG